MKHEISAVRPPHLKESWPGELTMFSHMENVAGIPHALSLVTTMKENGKTNATLNSWSSFTGTGGNFCAILTLATGGDAYRTITRDKVFCVNFLSQEYLPGCFKTIEHNGPDDDEIAAGGFTAEPAQTVNAPRIAEAFVSLECTLSAEYPLPGSETMRILVGTVQHAAVAEGYLDGGKKHGADGFVMYAGEVVEYEAGRLNPDGVKLPLRG